jgi:hypothetical protein
MALGLGVFLIVLGLVMATGVATYDLGAMPDTTLGWLLVCAGLLTLAVGTMANQQRARARHTDEHRDRRR